MSQVEDALKQHWPDLPERRWYGFLLCATSYPFGSHEQVAEEKLKAAGFDVLVFIASREEDEGRITCGNAILSGTRPFK